MVSSGRYGLRQDISVVNLSLANTDWYIKQMRDIMGLDLGWTDEDIDEIRPYRTPDGVTYRIQDIVSDAVIENYYGKRPVCISVTVGSGARKYKGKSLDHMLTMNGMIWVITEVKKSMDVDVEMSYDFFTNPNKFKTRGINDPSIYMDETTTRLTRNYGNAFLMVADTLRKEGDFDRAEKLTMTAVEKIPHAGEPVDFLASLYDQTGNIEKLKWLVDNAAVGDHLHHKIMLARAYRGQGDVTTAETILRDVFAQNQTHKPVFEEMIRLYYSQRDYENIHWLLMEWLRYNPNDPEAKAMLKKFEAGFRDGATETGVQP